MSVLERLALLDVAIGEARQRRERVTSERSRATRATAEAEAALDAYHEQVGAGEREPDLEEEARLAAAAAQAAAQASSRAWAARQRGAELALERAQGDREAFVLEHYGEIAAELAPRSERARARLQSAWEELQAAEGEWMREQRAWFALGVLEPDDVPVNPMSGDPADVRGRFARGVEAPMPRSLAGEPVA